MKVPAAEIAAVAEEYDRMRAEMGALWSSLTSLYGPGWWKGEMRPVAQSILTTSSALTTQAARCRVAAERAAIDALIRETGGVA